MRAPDEQCGGDAADTLKTEEMSMRRILTTSMLAMALTVAPAALAAPALVPFQGQLTDSSGVAIDGQRDIVITLYTVETGGSVVFTETHSNVDVVSGDFTVYLGSVNTGGSALDLRLFATEPNLWAEISIDGETITPRMRLATSPYAGFAPYCGDAQTLDGQPRSSFAAASHSHAFGDLTGVPADLADGDDDTLGGLTCAAGEIARHRGGGLWVCDVEADTLANVTCTIGHVLQRQGAGWGCVPISTVGQTGQFADLQNIPPGLLDGDDTGITGSGSNNEHAMFSGGGLVGSGVFTVGGNVGVGTSSPAEALDVAGNIKFSGGTLRLSNNGLGFETNSGVLALRVGGSVGFVNGANNTAHPTGAVLAGGSASNPNTASGIRAAVLGGYGNIASAFDSLVGAGGLNQASGQFAAIVAGFQNSATSRAGFVGGGEANSADTDRATIGGGFSNTVSGLEGTVGGGRTNVAGASRATVAGGIGNQATGIESFVGGGANNTASGWRAAVAGGRRNEAIALGGFVGGGTDNDANGEYCVVAGGQLNVSGAAAATHAVVGGGEGNSAAGSYSSIGGGQLNSATSIHATVAGGNGNTAGLGATVGGGENNRAFASYSTVGGGRNNDAELSGVVGGGVGNVAGNLAVIGGGSTNAAPGLAAVVPGGASNTASGAYSFAAGYRANASEDGCFVLADRSNPFADLTCDVPNQLVARFASGVVFYSHAFSGAGVNLPAGQSSWQSGSDRNIKRAFETVDPERVLASVMAMPITTWQYKAQSADVRHMGPMAQDFYREFKLGTDDKHISVVDADGVALAAIQGLNRKLEKSDQRQRELAAQVNRLERRLAGNVTAAPTERHASTLWGHPALLALALGIGLGVGRRRREAAHG